MIPKYAMSTPTTMASAKVITRKLREGPVGAVDMLAASAPGVQEVAVRSRRSGAYGSSEPVGALAAV